MKILTKEWFNLDRASEFVLHPIADIHCGNRGCDEARLKQTVATIAENENHYWVGLGDYAEFINVKDRRFDAKELAKWVKIEYLSDLAYYQRDRVCKILEPIAHKCLGLIKGNHEESIQRWSERDVYREIVGEIKRMGKFEAGHELAFGFSGWLRLKFYRSAKRNAASTIVISLHHGFVGGKLAGAKALNMQRWLWNHEADIAIFGHSHNASVQWEGVDALDRSGNLITRSRVGLFASTYLTRAYYAEVKGYFPLGMAKTRIVLRPHARHSQIEIISS